MERMGHTSSRAALIYQHVTRERDEEIAAGMGKLLSDARKTGKRSARSGTQPETRLMTITNGALITPPTWAGTTGAGDGNRTRMTSLEDRWRGPVRPM
jgi:hypothetical protein